MGASNTTGVETCHIYLGTTCFEVKMQDYNAIIFATLFATSAIFRAIDQLVLFRKPDTVIFPDWFYSPGWWVIDVYHISAGMKLWALAVAFYLCPYQLTIYTFALSWFIYYFIFDLFFHVLFKRKGHRENFIWNFIMLIVATLWGIFSKILSKFDFKI